MKYLIPILALVFLLQNKSHSAYSQDLFGSDRSFTPRSPFNSQGESGSDYLEDRNSMDPVSPEQNPSEELLALLSGSFPNDPTQETVSWTLPSDIHEQDTPLAIMDVDEGAAPPLVRHNSPEDELISGSQELLLASLTPRKRKIITNIKKLGESKRTLTNLLEAHARRDPENAELFRSLIKEVRENENSYSRKKTKFLTALSKAAIKRLRILTTPDEKRKYVKTLRKLKISIKAWEKECRNTVRSIAFSAKSLDYQTPALIFARERLKLFPNAAAQRALRDITELHASQSE